MNYLIGDLQGCDSALERLLQRIDFSPSRDHLYLLGDLVNRGPASLQTLRRLQGLGHDATCLLGNHDLHLLAVAYGARISNRSDSLDELLQAPDRDQLLNWLRQQRLAVFEHGWLMVHAGVVPQWDLATVLSLSAQVESLLKSQALPDFLKVMYGDQPKQWDPTLTGEARLRLAINVLTRIRFCSIEGVLDLTSKEGAAQAPTGMYPWFEVPGRQTQSVPIAFGHWSTLGLIHRPTLLALDTGCVWGGCLSAARLQEGWTEIIQVDCEQSLRPL